MINDFQHFEAGGRRPWVVGTSTCNALASTPYQTWAFHRAEMTGFVGSPFRLPNGNPVAFARVRTLDPRLIGTDRLLTLAGRALDAIGPVVAKVPPEARVAVALCLPDQTGARAGSARNLHSRRHIESSIVRAFVERGFEVMVRSFASGHAGAGDAILQIGRMLGRSELDVAIVLGVDSHYDPLRLEELFEQEKVLDTEWREAFVPGEAASALVLARPDVARELGMKPLGYIDAVGVNEEVATAKNDVGLLGQGLSRPAVRAAKQVAAEGAKIDWWLSDATGEALRMQELQLAWPRAIKIAGSETIAVDLLPSTFGDIGAATMTTGAVLALEGLRRGAPEGRFAIVTGSSDGGDRGVILLSAEMVDE